MAATNLQVQQYVNERIRPRAEQLRALYLALKDDVAAIGEVYANVSGASTWIDDRSDGPPKLLTPNDVLSYNTFAQRMISFIEGSITNENKLEGSQQWATVQAACVRPVQVV